MGSLIEYVSLHKKTHLIFDFDETIFMLLLPWEDCLLYAEKDLRKLDPELFANYWGKTFNWSLLQNEFIRKHGQAAKEIILRSNTLFETELLQGVRINHELVDFINDTNDKHFFLWSSNTSQVIEKVLKEFGIHQKFEKIITRNEVNLLKPEPEGFGLIYDPAVAKDKYVMVGDSAADRGGAENSGIDFFPVMYF